MSKGFSLYLDLVRFMAAMAVLMGHFAYKRFSGDYFDVFGYFHQDAVIVFFVLSGYVIAWVSNTKDNNLPTFAANRFARLYSVVLPAILLTLAADTIGMRLDPAVYVDKYEGDQPLWRILINLTYTQQIWNNDVRPFTNGPLWSLSYEFWYYAIFAAWYYFYGAKRWLFCALCLLIAGPKILLLLPTWLMGTLLLRIDSSNWNRYLLLGGFIASIVGYLFFRFYLTRYLPRFDQLDFSWKFLNDYVVAGLVSVNFIAAKGLAESGILAECLQKNIIAKPVRYLASCTFSIYVYHFPLLFMWAAILQVDSSSPVQPLLLLATTLGSIFLLANVTERRKRPYTRFFRQLLVRQTPSQPI